MTQAVRYPLTIFYDGSCPLCDAEMQAIKANDVNGLIELENCADPHFDRAWFGVSAQLQREMLTIIHARDAAFETTGRWYRGVDVFVLAYQAAGFNVLAAFWRNRWLRPLWDRLYPWIARNRYRLSALGLHWPYRWLAARALRRSRACQTAACKPKHVKQ